MFRFISIDPGTVTCGIAYWEIDDNFNIQNLTSETLVIDSDIPVEFRLHQLENDMILRFIQYQPLQIAHESAFINRFRPMAYGPIYTAIFVIRRAFINSLNTTFGMFSYPPKLVKSYVSTGNANKDDMLLAVSNISELNPFLTKKETEHEIDAIAIGYSHLTEIRKIPEILLI